MPSSNLSTRTAVNPPEKPKPPRRWTERDQKMKDMKQLADNPDGVLLQDQIRANGTTAPQEFPITDRNGMLQIELTSLEGRQQRWISPTLEGLVQHLASALWNANSLIKRQSYYLKESTWYETDEEREARQKNECVCGFCGSTYIPQTRLF